MDIPLTSTGFLATGHVNISLNYKPTQAAISHHQESRHYIITAFLATWRKADGLG